MAKLGFENGVAYLDNIISTQSKGYEFGSDILVDGDLEIWSTPTTLTNWDIGDGVGTNGTVERESTIIYHGTYSAKLTNVGGDMKLIAQKITSLTPGDSYKISFYARGAAGGEISNLFVFNDEFSSATQMWDWATNAWVALSLPPSTDNFTLTTSYTEYTASDYITVPASGIIYVGLVASGHQVGDIVYYDLISVKKVTEKSFTIFDISNPIDPATMATSDSVIRIRATGGAGATFLTLAKDGVLSFNNVEKMFLGDVVTFKATSDDGSTNIIEGVNNSEVTKFAVNSQGSLTLGKNITLAGILSGVTSDITGTVGTKLTISVPSPGETTDNAVGILIKADDGGYGTTGGTGGNLTLRAGSGNGNGGNVGGSLYLGYGIGSVGTTIGSDIFTDGDFEVWTNPTTLTNWTAFDASGTNGTLDQETVEVYSGTSAVKLTNVGGDFKLIYQVISGLTLNDVYRIKVWAKSASPSGVQAEVIVLNNTPALATQVWDWTTNAWVPWTGMPPSTEAFALTNSYQQFTASDDVSVPASSGLCVAFMGPTSTAGDIIYYDAATLQKITTVTGDNGYIILNKNTTYFGAIFTLRDQVCPVLMGAVPDSATAVAAVVGSPSNWATPGARLLSIRNGLGVNVGVTNGYEKAWIDCEGTLGNIGGRFINVTEVNAATYDLATDDYMLNVVYTTTGTCAIDLKTAQCVDGRIIWTKDAGGNASTYNITITTQGSEKIDGEDSFVINTDNGCVGFVAKSGNWYII